MSLCPYAVHHWRRSCEMEKESCACHWCVYDSVPSHINIVEGEDHFFDQSPNAEKLHGKVLDDAAGFLKRRLTKALALVPAFPKEITPVTSHTKLFRRCP